MTLTINDTTQNLKESLTVYNLRESFINKRKELGLTVRELGKKAGVSYTVIYDFEKRSIVPKVETLFKLADSLNLNLNITTETATEEEEILTPHQMIIKGLYMLGLNDEQVNEVMAFAEFTLSRKKS